MLNFTVFSLFGYTPQSQKWIFVLGSIFFLNFGLFTFTELVLPKIEIG